jgi:hypothetical protein
MGGQACVLYGAAEFSRDTDIALLASDENLQRLRAALRDLQARRIALPPFEQQYLTRGHAIHFRSYNPDAMNMRVDVISVMRGVDSFDQLWERRTRILGAEDEEYDVLSLHDLVRAKKTQRDKDWPMIRRLIEADYLDKNNPSEESVRFWFLESRTPDMLVQLARSYPQRATENAKHRPLLLHALSEDTRSIEAALEEEQKHEMEKDRSYWQPLRRELEQLRHAGISSEEPV